MLRLVLDTSLFVAGLRSASGASFRLLRLARAGRFEPAASVAMFLEYEEVLKRPEQRLAHGFSPDEIDRILGAFALLIVRVERRYSWRPQLLDADDEIFLEAAINVGADAIVTHNVRDFAPAQRFGVAVWTPGFAVKRIET